MLGALTVAASLYYAKNYSSGLGDISFLIGVFVGAGAMVCSTDLIATGATIGATTAGIVEYFNPEQAEAQRHEM